MPTIRPARPSDAPTISLLLRQLGYDVLPDDVPPRLSAIAADGGIAIVVEDDGGQVVGLAAAARLSVLHAGDRIGYITALVVDDSVRNQGIGRALVARLEEWAIAAGCIRLSVTSAEHRADAHAFYPRVGFPYTGRRFSRTLRT